MAQAARTGKILEPAGHFDIENNLKQRRPLAHVKQNPAALYDHAPLDPYTGHPTQISSSRLSAEQGQAIGLPQIAHLRDQSPGRTRAPQSYGTGFKGPPTALAIAHADEIGVRAPSLHHAAHLRALELLVKPPSIYDTADGLLNRARKAILPPMKTLPKSSKPSALLPIVQRQFRATRGQDLGPKSGVLPARTADLWRKHLEMEKLSPPPPPKRD